MYTNGLNPDCAGGKGGLRDNPGAPQCYIGFWQIIVNHDLSNWQQDINTFLFNFKCIAPVEHDEPLYPSIPSSSQIPDAIGYLIFKPQSEYNRGKKYPHLYSGIQF